MKITTAVDFCFLPNTHIHTETECKRVRYCIDAACTNETNEYFEYVT